MKRLDMCHLPHDTRHTFSTLCELNNLNVYTVKRIMGHKFQDLTKDVYTHVLISNLYDEIQKIKVF
jgi:integrase